MRWGLASWAVAFLTFFIVLAALAFFSGVLGALLGVADMSVTTGVVRWWFLILPVVALAAAIFAADRYARRHPRER